jgi:toxin-antitoxin system PIN domain toxin
MTFLPDVNIWVALTSNRHIHYSLAKEWLQSIESDQIAFCRISELGFLRLLTNAHVMGKDVLSPTEAWRVYDEWRTDDRVIFLPERAEFSESWRKLGEKIAGGPNAWTDAYLAAFAVHANATIVTLDRKFLPLGQAAIQSLI